ncbi:MULTISPECIES: SAM hydrolase/SAM-dependent halogenase family protein [Salinibaculum]|uniref:SAM hydrolase/SAM-dependent halogenase family protein n=1 Tax=Salinibaculum TaxID=2732368 RepID=UPI0030CFA3AF
MITLSSDFGCAYPAAMKGVLLSRTDARLVDVDHEFPRQDVRATAFWLREVLPFFPPAVHLVVVDPGVGTDRSALVVRAGDHALVGPDNGVLLPAARRIAADTPIRTFEVDYDQADPTTADPTAVTWPPRPSSSTFHGRDLFAPAAARVHELGVDGFEADEAFSPTDDVVDLRLPDPDIDDSGALGEALAVDSFGNVITNIPGTVLADHLGDHVKVNGVWASTRQAYDDVDPGHRVVTVGSHGNVELAVNQGRGDETFGVRAGGRVRVTW